uniref:Uncharacterized protein n=1 Tax=Arundo donax TaxID=35708 RepID=A0A0A9EJH7_ARUDO
MIQLVPELRRDGHPARRRGGVERVGGDEDLDDASQWRERDLGAGAGLPQYEPRGGLLVVRQREPAARRAVAVGEAGRAGELDALEAAGEPDGVLADWTHSDRLRAAGDDPRATGGDGKGGAGAPVGADLVDVEKVALRG